MRVLLEDIALHSNQVRLTGERVVGLFVGERVGILVGALVGALVVGKAVGLSKGDKV